MPGPGLLPCHAKILSRACFFASFLGNACRDKVWRYLRENYANISDAEEAYSINYFHDDELFGIQHEVTSTPTSSNQVPSSSVNASPMLAFSPLKHAEERNLLGSVLDVVSSGFVELTKRQRQQPIVHLFDKWLKLDVHQELTANYVSLEFLPLLSNALKVLLVNGKNNVLWRDEPWGRLFPNAFWAHFA